MFPKTIGQIELHCEIVHISRHYLHIFYVTYFNYFFLSEEPLNFHGVALSTAATPQSGGVKYANASIIAMSKTKDKSVRISERPQPLPDDAPSLKALAKANLPTDLQSTLMSIVKTHDIDNIQRPPVTILLPTFETRPTRFLLLSRFKPTPFQ